MFNQLQLALNDIWNVEPDLDAKWWKVVLDRARSFTFILVIGFLFLISFVLTAGISTIREFISASPPDVSVSITCLLDILVSLGIITVLFALMFKYLPDPKIKWKTARLGALITAILFVIGKFMLGYNFGL